MRSRAGYCKRLVCAATNSCDRPQFAHLGSAYSTSNVAPFRALSYRRLSYGIVQAEMAVQPFKRRPPKFQVQQTGNAIKGTVEKVTFSNEENGWSVLRIKLADQDLVTTVTGLAPGVTPGQYISAQGAWHNDREYGQQFQAESLTLEEPTTKEGIAKYLASGSIKGIGPKYGNRLVEHFGDELFGIIENSPHRLLEVDGIGPSRQKTITESWRDQAAIRAIMMFLHSHGVGTANSARIFKKYGEDAIAKVKHNPFCLAEDIHGIGFQSADKIAASLGIAPNAMERVCAGITYMLFEKTNEGHCGQPREKLLALVSDLLELDPTYIEKGLAIQIQKRVLIQQWVENVECIFLSSLHHNETAIAEKLARMLREPQPWPKTTINEAAIRLV
eukprot:CAMPEP_0198205180 /NCGR_PEP_ID=MMETSP1445-20131203/8672_1 /TAXON_ID=36898 /ORGANISM="Pyramimonas sp., Strain CCMP2087" /LENGTH=387 /DNA_ID=CAMNT_0043877361 /DNA_START=400 /DNA_END=1560 /DNA_ORIENTATION=-